MTDHASKQTALFFGFLTAAMTAASAQAAPVRTVAPTEAAAVHRTASVQETVARPQPATPERKIRQGGERAKAARAS